MEGPKRESLDWLVQISLSASVILVQLFPVHLLSEMQENLVKDSELALNLRGS